MLKLFCCYIRRREMLLIYLYSTDEQRVEADRLSEGHRDGDERTDTDRDKDTDEGRCIQTDKTEIDISADGYK